jgi:site-specific DNA-methyltransferase (adenine-specific)
MGFNALYYGDNLKWLRDHKYFADNSVDLIYLDPPFNSKADYNLLFNEPNKGDKSQAQIKAFDDTWHWDSEASDMAFKELAQNKPQVAEFILWLSRQGKTNQSIAAYLSMMAVRLIELQRVLKQTGSLYLHCDPTASHYLKVILDQIFGAKNFQNEIVWCYKGRERPLAQWNSKHDIILFYSKEPDAKRVFNWEDVSEQYSQVTLAKFKYKDEEGVFRIRGHNIQGSPYRAQTDLSYGVMEEHPGLVYKDRPAEGVAPRDWWEIPFINQASKERLGYPTQKPMALLERIINASSNIGDIVLDPFCGCGTTIDAAQGLKRRWIGIDVTWLAIDLVVKRLNTAHGSNVISTYEIHGKPYDTASAQALANKSKKEFEIWAISLVGAAPREHDGGVDGIFGFVEKDKNMRTIIVQVKGGDVLTPSMVRDLIGTVKKEGAAIGLLVTLREPTDGMKALAVHSEPYKSELWDKEFPSIQIRTVGELLEGKGFDLPPTQSPLKNAQLARERGDQIRQGI